MTDRLRRIFRPLHDGRHGSSNALLIACVGLCLSAELNIAVAGDQPDAPLQSASSQTASSASQPVSARDIAAVSDTRAQPSEYNIFGLSAAPIDSPMVTDRPDFTESTLTVPRGRFQLEAGYTFTYDDENGSRHTDHTMPEALLRFGMSDDLELRIFWSGWSFSEAMFQERNRVGRRVSRHEHDDGGADMSLGLKYHIAAQDGWQPDLGVIVELGLPTGTVSKSEHDVVPAVKLLWAYSLTERLGLAGNVNLVVPQSDHGRFLQTQASLSMSYSLTEWLGLYAEYFGIYPDARGSDAAHYVNGGFAIPINDNFQWDVRVGAGLNEQADDLFAGTGFSIRW